MRLTSRFSSGRLIVVTALLVSAVSVPLVYSRNSRVQTRRASNPSPGVRVSRNSSSQTGSIDQPAQISESGRLQIAALIAEKEGRTPAQRKIDSQLLQAVRESRGQQMVAGVNLQPIDVKADDAGKLAVDISARVTDDLVARLQNLNCKIIYPSVRYSSIRAEIRLSDVETIAAFPEVRFIQLAVPGYTNKVIGTSSADLYNLANQGQRSFAMRAENVRNKLSSYLANHPAGPMFTGTIDSEGDRTHRADDARNTFGYAGEGVRIGVLSDSFNRFGNLSTLISNGNLPGPGNPFGNLTPVTVVQDQVQNGNDEGAEMLQIVHDIAPRAQLFFATAVISEASFADNILALRNAPNNCDIILDDVGYFDEPPFQDGILAQAVNTVTASGALYFSAAGNGGSVAKGTAGVWEGDFTDAGSTLIIPGNGKSGTVLNFGTVDAPIQGNAITSFGHGFTLSWSDPMGGSNNDYDCFIMDPTLSTVRASATNIQNGTQNPFEIFTSGTIHRNDQLIVFKSSTAAVRAINLNTNGGTLAVATVGQTYGHSAAANAFSVAATPTAGGFDFFSPTGPFPNEFSGSSVVEKFSSDGPRRIFYNADGSAITPGNVLFAGNGGTVRNKPDITAADGVTVQFFSNTTQFFGTSAAAPHAAAIAALLKSANPSMTPDQIRNALTSTALDIESPGRDNVSGFGIIQAFQAMQSIQPTPALHLSMGTVNATEGPFSNHNGVIEPNETVNVVISLNNPSPVIARNVKATLIGPGSNFVPPVLYGTIPASSSVANSDTPFQFAITRFSGCGLPLQFYLIVSFDGDTSPQQFSFTINTGKPLPAFSATLGHPASGTAFTSFSAKQTGILNRNGTATACATGINNPGLADPTGQRTFDAYTFRNNGPSQCVTVTLTSPNGANLYVAAYNFGGFDRTNVAASQLSGVPGSSGTLQTFSFFASGGGANFTIVVHEIDPGGAADTPYTLNVPVLACAAGPSCGQFTLLPSSLPVGAVGAQYPPQAFAFTGGSGINTTTIGTGQFDQLPAGMTLSGNTLSGTPTQAGGFLIVANIQDAICDSTTVSRDLRISGGLLPASVTAISGNHQSTPPGTTFPLPLQVIVRDKANKPVPGVKVVFNPPSDNFGTAATGTFAGSSSFITDANGIATSSPFTANAVQGSYGFAAAVFGTGGIGTTFGMSNSCAPIVTNNADSGPGSLRDAITNACDHGTVTFAPNVTGTVALTSGEIVISRSVRIQGPGANVLAISGSHKSRVFTVNPADSSNFSAIISGLTIRDGSPSISDTVGGGGGILALHLAHLIVLDSVITDNDVSNSPIPSGGGIEIGGIAILEINGSSITHNIASLNGGGIHLIGAFQAIITNTTITGNSAGAMGKGGGIGVEFVNPNQFVPNSTVTNSTIFGNSANVGGNISDPDNRSSVGLQNSIVAGGILIGVSPVGPDVNGAGLADFGFNLIQDPSSTTLVPKIAGKSPVLLPLGNYGGLTPTMPPQPGSPAINSGMASKFADLDQRGLLRRPDGNSDIGAVGTDYALSLVGGTPQSTPIGASFKQPLKVRVTESGYNISGVTVTFTTPPSGASAQFAGSTTGTALTDLNGIATAPTLTANGFGGSFAISAGIGNALVSPISFSLTNIAPASITATAGTPQSTLPATAFSVPMQVAVVDSNNNPLEGITVTFTAPTSGPSGTFPGGSTSVGVITDSNGVAVAPVFTANHFGGSYSVTARAGGNIPVASFSLTNIAVPASILAVAGTPQNAPPSTQFQSALKATVRDSNNNLLQGINVTFTAPDNGASGTFAGGTTSATVATDLAGVATAPAFMANAISGTYTVSASVGGNVTPALFSLRNVQPGPPASFAATAGTPQTVTIGCDFLTSLRANVLDADGVPVGGITVTFTVTPNGNTGATFPGDTLVSTAITDNNGIATAPILTANEFGGDYTVTATITQLAAPVTYNLTNRIKFGDLTGEGTVNVQDLLVMANALAGNTHLSPGRKMMADVLQDSGHLVNVQDLFILANFLAGNITTLPIVPTAQNPETQFDSLVTMRQFSLEWRGIIGAAQLRNVDDTVHQTSNDEMWLAPDLPRSRFRLSGLYWREPIRFR